MDMGDEFTGDLNIVYLGKTSVNFNIGEIEHTFSSNKKLCDYIEANLDINLARIIELENAAGGEISSTQQIYLEQKAVANGHRQAIKKVLENFSNQ